MLFHAAWTMGCDDADIPAGKTDGTPAEVAAQHRPAAEQAPSPEAPGAPSLDQVTLEPASFREPAALGPADRPFAIPGQPGREPTNKDDREDDTKRDPGARDEGQDPDDDAAAVGAIGPRKGRFQLTYYWMAHEKKRKRRNNTRIYTSGCKPIARVERSFATRLALEGTGMLSDGRLVNVAGPCKCNYSPCFFVVDEDEKRWGVGVENRPLSPFRSVAVDPSTVSIGTKLYIPELDGLVMPGAPPWGGFVHDGCVIADDRGGGVAGKQLDFFMVRKPYYRAFHRRHRLTQVTVHDGGERCARERKDLQPVDRNSI